MTQTRARDRQDGVGRHSLDADEACNPVRDHPGLAAASAGQNQDRAVEMADSVTLLGIEALKEIHGSEAILDSSTALKVSWECHCFHPH